MRKEDIPAFARPPYIWMVVLFKGILLKTPKAGAQTNIYCAVSEDLKEVSGKYFRYVHVCVCVRVCALGCIRDIANISRKTKTQ